MFTYTYGINIILCVAKTRLTKITFYLKFSEISSWIQEIKDNIELMRATISEAAFHYNDKGIKRGKFQSFTCFKDKDIKMAHTLVKDAS